MNASESDSTVRPNPEPDSTTGPAPGVSRSSASALGYWLRRLLVCNPFFLVSAALLLYGVARISSDANLFAGETANLVFNFTALQAYGALLVLTAIGLSRRAIWYDSALLVVLENGLVLVPFMLISQASFIEPLLGQALLLVAGAAAAGRALWIRRAYPSFNVPDPALRLGAVLLALNMGAPLVVRSVVDRTSVDDWALPNQFIWAVLLPLAVLGANLLPRPSRHGGLNPERAWLPIFIYGLWVVGTGVHAWSLGYVCKQEFGWSQIAPACCAAIWTLFHRATDFLPAPCPRLRVSLLLLAFPVPLLAWGNPSTMIPLLAANHLLYVLLMCRDSQVLARAARELALASLVLAGALVPPTWIQLIVPPITQTQWLALLLGAYGFRSCWKLTHPGVALLSGIALALAVGVLLPHHSSASLGMQAGLAWMLIHSLGWRQDAARGLRVAVGVGWVVHAMLCAEPASWEVGATMSTIALMVLVAWWVVARQRQERRLVFIPLAALLTFVCAPSHWLIAHSPAGLLALIASFLLFGVGAQIAFRRHRVPVNS